MFIIMGNEYRRVYKQIFRLERILSTYFDKTIDYRLFIAATSSTVYQNT